MTSLHWLIALICIWGSSAIGASVTATPAIFAGATISTVIIAVTLAINEKISVDK